VFFDKDGLYINEAARIRGRGPEQITDKCANGHDRWCTRCGGCAVHWFKIGRCKCVEGSFGVTQ